MKTTAGRFVTGWFSPCFDWGEHARHVALSCSCSFQLAHSNKSNARYHSEAGLSSEHLSSFWKNDPGLRPDLL